MYNTMLIPNKQTTNYFHDGISLNCPAMEKGNGE